MRLRDLALRSVRSCARLLVPPALAATIVVPAWLLDRPGFLDLLHSALGLATVGAALAIVAVCLGFHLVTGSKFAGWYAEAALPTAAACLVLLPLTGTPAGPPPTDAAASPGTSTGSSTGPSTGPSSRETTPPAVDRAGPRTSDVRPYVFAPGDARPDDPRFGSPVARELRTTAAKVDPSGSLRRDGARPGTPTKLPPAARAPEVFADIADATATPGRGSALIGVVGRPAQGSVRLVETGEGARQALELSNLRAGTPGAPLEVHLVPGSTRQQLSRTVLGTARQGSAVQTFALPRDVRLTAPATVMLWQPDAGVLLATAGIAPERPRPSGP